MKKILILILLASGFHTFSQTFSEAWTINLPAKYKSAAATAWADLDNDGLLDIVLLLKDGNDSSFISIYKGDTTLSAIPQEVERFPVTGKDIFFIHDINADNSLDIIIPGDAATIFLNQENFSFDDSVVSVPPFSKMLFEDMDNDGLPEWIVKDDQSEKLILFKQDNGQWIAQPAMDIRITTMEAVDADGNGFMDMFVSGAVNVDSLFTGFLINEGDFNFTPYKRIAAQGVASKGDLNQDGFFDLIFSGKDSLNNEILRAYQSETIGYAIDTIQFDFLQPEFFIADLNSDGKADLSWWTKTASGDSIRLMKTGMDEFDTLSVSHVVLDRFGDVEHDGDLDVIQVLKKDSLRIVLFVNDAPFNGPPAAPGLAYSFIIFDHVFMTWLGAGDDHTPSQALTYDVYMDGLSGSEFDLVNGRRLKVSHGNNGTANFVLIQPPVMTGFNFAIETVDNSLHALGGPGGICFGTIQSCSVANIDSVRVCSFEQLTFHAPPNSAWYSFSSGFLQNATSLTYTAGLEPDVVFFFNPSYPDCAHLRAWYIDVKDTTRHEEDTLYVCEDQRIHLTTGDFWKSIRWENQAGGLLGITPVLDYTVEHAEEIHAITSLGTGCSVDHKFDIRISKPEVNITAENTYVFYGKSVQLIASGAATYLWQAANGLFDITIPDPNVSPTESTTYTVTGYDTVGCEDQATIRITVERNGFIPSLFTPNNDAKNDVLKIYGLSDADDFTFEIFNRNGNLVFSTSSVSEADRGWDGTSRGIRQPNGVYFWKVRGKLFSGEPIQLNGKDSGSIVLLR